MQPDPAKTPAQLDNRLLAALPKRDRRKILSSCDSVALRRGEPGDRIRDVYFPTDSFVSVLTPPADYAGLEVRLVGNEGMIGTPLILGVEVTQIRTFIQGAGRSPCSTARACKAPPAAVMGRRRTYMTSAWADAAGRGERKPASGLLKGHNEHDDPCGRFSP